MRDKTVLGVIGYGVIGKAVAEAFRERHFEVRVYDKYKPELGTFKDVLQADIIFLCLPTPTFGMHQNTDAIQEVCAELDEQRYSGTVILRSTVLPGTTARLGLKHPSLKIVHNPEFIRERFTKTDMINQKAIILGSLSEDGLKAARNLWLAYDHTARIVWVHPTESEMVKYVHNCFLATKVSFFNEVYELANKIGMSYDNIMLGVHAIDQVGPNHTKVPGPDGKFGFGGMCFPKDTKAFLSFAREHGIEMEVLSGAVTGNIARRPEEM